MRSPLVVNAFKDTLKAGGPQTVCIGPRAVVRAAVTQDELDGRFGGYIVYVDRTTKDKFMGVWGTRRTSASRSLLRNRGLVIEITRKKPSNVRVKFWSVRGPLA